MYHYGLFEKKLESVWILFLERTLPNFILSKAPIQEWVRVLLFDKVSRPTSFGNPYGSNMTPSNIRNGRLDFPTSLNNFYSCSASSGYAGFAGTIWMGSNLYSTLTGDVI